MVSVAPTRTTVAAIPDKCRRLSSLVVALFITAALCQAALYHGLYALLRLIGLLLMVTKFARVDFSAIYLIR